MRDSHPIFDAIFASTTSVTATLARTLISSESTCNLNHICFDCLVHYPQLPVIAAVLVACVRFDVKDDLFLPYGAKRDSMYVGIKSRELCMVLIVS